MAPCSWIAVHSCRRSVTQDEAASMLTLCSASGSVTCGLHPSALYSTLGGMIRFVEASVQGHRLLGPSAIRAVDQGVAPMVDDADGQVS